MAWVADNQELRTYDPERGLELRKAGGGSDGSRDFGRPKKPSMWFLQAGRRVFELNKPGEIEVLAGFSAISTTRRATDEERSADPELKGFFTWEVVSGFGPTGLVLDLAVGSPSTWMASAGESRVTDLDLVLIVREARRGLGC